jgi:hypothetical protein
MLDTVAPQPPSKPGRESVTDLVIDDLKRRREGGILKYGRQLETHNGRSFVIDAFQEALDLVCYLRGLAQEHNDSEQAVSELETAVKTLLLLHRAGGPNLAWLRSAIVNVDRAIRLLTPPGRSGEPGLPLTP